MKLEEIAAALYDEACKAQWRRQNPKADPLEADPRKIGCPFDELWPAPKDHYLSMAKWVFERTP